MIAIKFQTIERTYRSKTRKSLTCNAVSNDKILSSVVLNSNSTIEDVAMLVVAFVTKCQEKYARDLNNDVSLISRCDEILL